MNSQPTQPFQAPRDILSARLAALVNGASDQAAPLLFTYRVSGGPPGKRLLSVVRLSAAGELRYEHSDELEERKAVKGKSRLPQDEALAIFRQVQESGLLEWREKGKGFLPDAVIGSVILESDDAQFTVHFPANEQHPMHQGVGMPPPVPRLRPVLDRLRELAHMESPARRAP